MKYHTLHPATISIVAILIVISSLHAWSQGLSPYNRDFPYRIISDDEVLPATDSLKALIIVFKEQKTESALRSIANNRQLQEIKLFNPPQAMLDSISGLRLDTLTYLFIEQYAGTVLSLSCFPMIELLRIESTVLKTLCMEKFAFHRLEIMSIDAPQLVEWESNKSFPQLGLIDLKAPALHYLPIKDMPTITQFCFYCSFDTLPSNLCSYKKLRFISFNNYKPISVEKCLVQKIRKARYSDITVYDTINGAVIFQVLSRDRKK